MSLADQDPRKLAVYIDGFNLYNGLHSTSGRAHLWLDVVALARSLRPQSDLVMVKYFTAHVLDNPGGTSRQDAYLNALRAHCGPRLDIVLGRYQRRTVKCRACGHERPHYEEKETDVNIAVSVVSDAMRGVADDALIISADSDLAAAVRTVNQLVPGFFVAAAFPPGRYSAQLKQIAPASFKISPSKIAKAQLPPTVVDPASGTKYTRPAYWV